MVVERAVPVINQTTLPAAPIGVAYSQQLTVTGGTTPVTFAVTTGTLPAGLTISADRPDLGHGDHGRVLDRLHDHRRPTPPA